MSRRAVLSVTGVLACPLPASATAQWPREDPEELQPLMDIDDVVAATEKLSKESYLLTFRGVDETSYTGMTVNGYPFDTKEQGVYVSAISGVPLFTSSAKYDSLNGRVSFWAPINASSICERTDLNDKKDLPQILWRTEVVERASLTHLGHVFDDGPAPTGKRYDINAGALRFVPGQAPEGDKTQASAKRFAGGLLEAPPLRSAK